MGTSFRHTHAHWGAYTAKVEDGRLVSVERFEGDPVPNELIDAVPSAVYAESRVKQPAVRAGYLERGPQGSGSGRGAEPFVNVSWDEALGLITRELTRIKREHGNAAIFGGSSGWASAGRLHHAPTLLHRFLNGFGGFTDHVTNYSFGAALVIMPHVVGSVESVAGALTSWPSIVKHTKLAVMFGGAALRHGRVTFGGAGDRSYEKWLRRAKEAGVAFVNISPIHDDAPDFLDAQWISPRPTTDVALMLGLAHTLVTENLHDQAFLDRYCVGFDRFRSYLLGEKDGQPKDAAWAAGVADVEVDEIRTLARRMAGCRTMIMTAWSLQRADHGEQVCWMTTVLASMLGQIGLPGGGFGFGYGSMNGVGNPRRRVSVPGLISAGKNPIDGFIPVARITDMLLNPGEVIDFNGMKLTFPDIQLIYWAGGNPFHHQQDLNRLLRGWRRPKTIIVHEPWWTSTARHADIVLPTTTTLERNDIGASPFDRFFFAMQQAIEPVGQARNDYDIFADLAGRLGFRQDFTEGRGEMEWLRHLYDVARQGAAQHKVELVEFDAFWERGHVEIPEPEDDYVMLADFRADPDAHPLNTPSGKIEIYSETIAAFGYDDCPPHAAWLEPAEWLGGESARRWPLHILSSQPTQRLHSQMDDGSVSRSHKVRQREPIWINPADAKPRHINDGDIVRVFNDRGACLAGAVVTEAMRPGVVQLSNGAWYDPVEPGTMGSLERHGNANVLTLDKGTSKLAQGPSALTALVQIEKYDGKAPPISVFSPPRMVGPKAS